MTKHSRIIEEMHETVQGLHSGGLIDERRMREFEALYRANQVPKFNADSVKALRSRLNVSQAGLGHHYQYQRLPLSAPGKPEQRTPVALPVNCWRCWTGRGWRLCFSRSGYTFRGSVRYEKTI